MNDVRRIDRPRGSSLVAVAMAAVAAVAIVAAVAFLDYFGALIVLPWSLGSFAAVGFVVTLLRPRHPVGWLFLLAGTCYVATMTASAWTWSALVGAPGSLPGGELAAWLASSLWVPAVGGTLLGIILFPTGRPPTPRWRPVIVAIVAVLGLTAVVTAFAPRHVTLPSPFTGGFEASAGQIPNPLRLPAPIADALLAISPAIELVPVPVFLVTLAAVVVRFRRSTGVERQQLKWFALAASISIGMLTLSMLVPLGPAADVAWAAGMISWGLVPIATGIAILRHRLFDIDVVIRRTVVYGLVVAVLGAAYAALVLVMQSVFAGIAGGTLPVALSTLVIAALFAPVRARVQAIVDKRFYRSRYDSRRTLEEFGARLRDEVELESVTGALAAVAGRAVQPAGASVWLRTRKA